MTREEAVKKHYDIKCHITESKKILAIIDKIYDDFEEELKKAYIEGSNDAWKAIKEKNANNTRTIPSA